ncbi:hypothetical protein LSTR_LSTR015152 [Laodelphax striatellus]|uniref:Uncharacterized protein n=1 Tax=Laodelphax striatellus TaxID=195883 RepID=A0A482XCG7_LAOST|nr:hypothetical protein LSTR_LSTR007808 [Laodelphax striatellus]RZF43168.1 hypothetical protein LSTR_LSTR015152 [Laodelphax striatellus]
MFSSDQSIVFQANKRAPGTLSPTVTHRHVVPGVEIYSDLRHKSRAHTHTNTHSRLSPVHLANAQEMRLLAVVFWPNDVQRRVSFA